MVKGLYFGYEKGEVCHRNGCAGVIAEDQPGDCSCHICPPCAECTTPREYCPECGYQAKHDVVINNYVCNWPPVSPAFTAMEPRKLDRTKIDFVTKPHTHFSMIIEGVYPPGTTSEEVLAVIPRGTFGGRLEKFSGGEFRYVAYTD